MRATTAPRVEQQPTSTGAASRYPLLWQAFTATAWAMEPAFLSRVADLLSFRDAGGRLGGAEIASLLASAAAANGPRTGGGQQGHVAVIPVYGPIAHRMGGMTDVSGGTSCEAIAQSLRAALADPSIGAIVLDVDSPGGTVDGIPELVGEVAAARGVKPLVAVANTMAASAAYWIAAACDELSVTPSGTVGSIGVFGVHKDASGAYEQAGVKPTVIASQVSPYKAEGGVDFLPLSEDTRAYMQARVDELAGQFVGDVARLRGRTAEEVATTFGQGRLVNARQAAEVGMVDRVETLDAAVARLMRRRPVSAGGGARAVPSQAQEAVSAALRSLSPSSSVPAALCPAAGTLDTHQAAAQAAVRRSLSRLTRRDCTD